MEYGNSLLIRSVILVLAIVAGAQALGCWSGDQLYGGGVKTKCDANATYCVLWYDYGFDQDIFAYCDESNLCKKVGFTNYTYYGVNCCNTDYCNELPPAPTGYTEWWPDYTTPSWLDMLKERIAGKPTH
ncbi:hypothetical protein M3Y97_00648600 [Aphelenchoides bicaudatus]|nr:hypothetical protein M3Y97_01165100 [Aphelenchoides bicaudatus]KAI6184919.1 hypothetical protein M3Y97_00648600 [Aphelenchoides bicaudatus]